MQKTGKKIQAFTVSDAFDDFIRFKRSAGLSPKTLETYQHHFEAVGKYIDFQIPVRQLTSAAVAEAIAEIAGTDLSTSSIRAYTATLGSFFSWCEAEHICKVKISLFRARESVPEIYTEEELRKLLQAPKRPTFAELRAWTIVNLLIGSGCRAGTIRYIQVRDVYLENRMIICRHMKARNVITIPLTDSLISALSWYMRIRGGDPADWLFCTENGEQMTEAALRSSMNRYNASRGVDRTGLHKFRHTFARMYLVDCGGDALKLQRLLGHSTLDMTNHYVRIFAGDLVEDAQMRSPLEHLTRKPKHKKIGR